MDELALSCFRFNTLKSLNQFKEITEKIKQLRQQKGIGQQAIASALNLTVAAYNRIENNKTQLTVNNLFTIAEALNISVVALLELYSGFHAYNSNNVVMTNFNHGTLNLAIDLKELEKLLKKRTE